MASEWDMESCNEIIFALGRLNRHLGKCISNFEGEHRGNEIGKRIGKEEDCWSSLTKRSCAWQTGREKENNISCW